MDPNDSPDPPKGVQNGSFQGSKTGHFELSGGLEDLRSRDLDPNIEVRHLIWRSPEEVIRPFGSCTGDSIPSEAR